MITSQNLCGRCPEPTSDLELIETRFQNGLCFLKLECPHCPLQWLAEVSMPSDEDFVRAARRPDLPPPTWRVVHIEPIDGQIGARSAPDRLHA